MSCVKKYAPLPYEKMRTGAYNSLAPVPLYRAFRCRQKVMSEGRSGFRLRHMASQAGKGFSSVRYHAQVTQGDERGCDMKKMRTDAQKEEEDA